MSTQKLDVLFTIDQNYIQHFCVTLTSLLENNCEMIGRIFLISDIREEEKLANTFLFFKKKYRKQIVSLSFNRSIVDKFKVDGHISQASYYRLFLSEILPQDVDRILFLDSDIIVNGKLDFFLSLNFNKTHEIKAHTLQESGNEEYYLYAISNLSDQKKDRLKSLGLSANKYFNAGVLLINLKKWREEHITDKLVSVALKHKDKLIYHDQDTLNIVFENQWGELDEIYNGINLEFTGLSENKEYIIIHYTNFPKPWHFKNQHPLKQKYWLYLWKTPFRYYIPPDLTIRNVLDLKVIPKGKRVSQRLFGKFMMRVNSKKHKVV